MKIAFVTNIIAPYTHAVFEAVCKSPEDRLQVLCCSDNEPSRAWNVPPPSNYSVVILEGMRLHRSYTQHIYLNPGVWSALSAFDPDVVFINAFSPTMVIAAAWARIHRRPYCVTTDGWKLTDPGEWSRIHRLFRRLLVPRAAFGLGAGELSLELLESYGLPRSRLLKLPIVSSVPRPTSYSSVTERPFDLLWCGNIDDERKGVYFFCRVVEKLKLLQGTLRVRVAGNGELREWLQDRLADLGVEFQFDGYLQAQDLASFYNSGRLFLFPSRGDPWGLVVNEAMSAGTPTIASSKSASGLELSKRSGGVICLDLDEDKWVEAAYRLLQNSDHWKSLSAANIQLAEQFTVEEPAANLLRAAQEATRAAAR
ncbi:glycosyltransferase [Bradyrhizobium sp.]|uniref:glycosyltransferase n=1 Tax=Bradyrhizobium sp. TaxID=376 RepID=UPI0039E6D4E0